mgnify:CR=1 FL=1
MVGDGYPASERNASFHPGDRNGLKSAGGANDQAIFDISEYWHLAVKHRILIVCALFAALIVGVMATLLMTPIYTATATIQIDREAARVLNVEDGSPRESMIAGEEFFQTQYGLLQSRSLTERVIDSLGLATGDLFLQQMNINPLDVAPGSAAEQAAKHRNQVIAAVQANLSVAPVRGSRLVNVSFNSPSAVLSQRVANAFASNFIQANLDRKYESSSYAREFLDEQIAQTKIKLEDAERQLVAYAANQQIVNVSESGRQGDSEPRSLAATNLAALNSALAEARAAKVAAEVKWLQARSTPLLSLPEVLENPAIQRLTEERAKLSSTYQENLQLYRPDFPQMQQLKAQIDELDRQISTIGGRIRNSIQGQFSEAANRERALQTQVERLTGEVLDMRSRSINYNILQRELDTSRTLYDALLQRYKEVGVTAGISTNNISIVDQADIPVKPSKPNLILNLAIAMIVGLGLGVLAVLIIEALDETLATPEDVETKLGVPALGVIPLLQKGVTPSQALNDARSPFSEAYYSLRTALQFSTPNGTPDSILVTSSRPAEGKSTTAFAVAQNLARVGKRVLLIDGDLRNPSMHRILGTNNDAGMSNLLSRSSDLVSVLHKTQTVNLSFIPCGPLPPNPAELWAGDRLREILIEALTQFDHVVIDGPPVLGFADVPLLSSAVSGTLFVVESRSTRRGQARGALGRLAIGNGRLLGVVLSKFSAKTNQYGAYDYAYDYEYGSRPDQFKKVGGK